MMGERSPLWHSNARGVFFGLSLATPARRWCAPFWRERLLPCATMWRRRRAPGPRCGRCAAWAGCSRSDLWNQIKADVLGLPLLLPRTSVGSPFGAAIVAGNGSGRVSQRARFAQGMVRLERRFEPSQVQPRAIARSSTRLYRRHLNATHT